MAARRSSERSKQLAPGHTPTVTQVAEVHAQIRQCLVTRFGARGKAIRILYGGSVRPSNARELLSGPEVGGALIGGASLKVKDFNAHPGAAGAGRPD